MLTIFESVDSKQPRSKLTESSRSATQCPISLEVKGGGESYDMKTKCKEHKITENKKSVKISTVVGAEE